VKGKSLKDNEFMAPASWMLAWCILNEGGNANLSDAANRFFNFTWWERDLIAEDYDVLTNAASFNCAVIYTHLLSQENQDYELLSRNTKWALNSFLERWPNDPREAEVRNIPEHGGFIFLVRKNRGWYPHGQPAAVWALGFATDLD
jgi:hypothetical protein